MKNSHAYGVDKLDITVVKLAATVLLPVITHIVNLSLASSIYPARWKISRLIPQLKNKDSERISPGSYCPVAQLLLISKLTERVVQSQLLNYLEESSQLSHNHQAYRSRLSTNTGLIQVMDSIATATDLNHINASMSSNLSAAFDCMVHNTLLDKLEYYRLREG